MIFVSTMTYALGKELGFPEASAEFQRQLSEPSSDSLPCVRTIARLRSYDAVGVWHDASATCLGKSRSRAFYSALQAMKDDDDVHVTVDDDCEADSYTLGLMLEALLEPRTIVIVPLVTRGSNVVNVALDPQGVERRTKMGARVVPIVSGGFGIVGMTRATMLHLVAAHPTLHFLDDENSQPGVPQVRKPALFFDLIEPVGDGTDENCWLGEDVSFCRRARSAGVRLEALVTGLSSHAGQTLRLERVTELDTVKPRGTYGTKENPSPAYLALNPPGVQS